MKLIGYIAAAILIFFGVLFLWGAFSPSGSPGWIPIGLISVGIGFAIIWYVGRRAAAGAENVTNVTYQVDLPGDVNLEKMKCQSCGGELTMKNITMVAGAPVVNCPYCGTNYQLTEEPKW